MVQEGRMSLLMRERETYVEAYKLKLNHNTEEPFTVTDDTHAHTEVRKFGMLHHRKSFAIG